MIPKASTGTVAPRRKEQSSGVIKSTPIVVDVVMMIDNATSPPAMYVQRFEACPPLIDPTKTKPAVIAAFNPKPLANPSARSGMSP
jgi:hypothetical protein